MSLILTFVLQAGPAPLELDLYRAQVAAAESAIRLGEIAVARQWLDETNPRLRGLEWRLHDAALDESRASFSSGDSGASALDVSPDGRIIALGLTSGVVSLHDSSDGARIAELGRHAEGVTYLRFDARGERLVSASFDRTVRSWDVRKRELLVDFRGHGFPVGGAAFSPDGARIASCSYETSSGGVVGTVHVWDAADGRVLSTLEGGRKPLVGIEFSPDGRRIAAGSWNFCVLVWDAAGGAPIGCAMPDEGIYNAVDDAAWTADGAFVLGASRDHTARAWNADTGELVATLRGHTDAVDKLALSPDGRLVATASSDGSVKLWNTADWSLRSTLRGHSDDVSSCAFTADSRVLHTISKDGTVRAWDATTERYGGARWGTTHAAYVARFSPDDARVAVATYDGRIEIRDSRTLAVIRAWDAHPSDKSCHGLAWTPDGRRLVSGSWEPVVRVWDTDSGDALLELQHDAGTTYLAVSPDGLLVAACSRKQVLLANLEDGARVRTFDGHSTTVLGAVFSPDSRFCVSTARDGKAISWSVADGSTRWEANPGDADVVEAVYTPDGSGVVIAGRSGRVTLHDAATGTLVRELARLRHGIDHIAITPDGSRIAAASNVVALIDVQNGRVVGELRPHAEHPYNVDFDARGERLISCSTDRTVVISDAVPLRTRLAPTAPR